MRTSMIVALATLASISTASAQTPNKYCVIKSGAGHFVTLQPRNATVVDCAIIAQGLEQQVGAPAPNQYQLACQSGGLFMVSTPKPWSATNVVQSDFNKPGLPQATIDACGKAWQTP